MTESDNILPQNHEYTYKNGNIIAGRYTVVKPLGFGGFAEVYHCKDAELAARSVAVKVITEPEIRIQEAKAAAQLEHPNIVQVYDAISLENGMSIIIFRYIDGDTLEEKLIKTKYRRFPLDEQTLTIIREIASAIDFAHEKNIIHRDIKPSNIIIDKTGKAYLTDFGLAEIKESLQGPSMITQDVAHRLSGTVPYMAPEQLVDLKPGDKRSDLYSLGVVTYEVLTGRFPYQGRDTKLIIQIGTVEPMPPNLANPELPQNLNDVLLKALNKDPEQRYESCLEFVVALEEATKAYLQNNTLYEQATAYMESKDWRNALATFELLQKQAPANFRDLGFQLERAERKVRGLIQFEQAESLFQEKKYDESLETLNFLEKTDPDFPIADLREKILTEKATVEQQTREELYQQAVNQYDAGNYEESLETISIILAQDPNFSDLQNIRSKAQKKADQHRHWRELYNAGVVAMSQENWGTALSSFENLREENPTYEDVETRLVMTRHLQRLSGLLNDAQQLLADEKFTASIDKIDELTNIDDKYKTEQVTQLREEAVNRLYRRSERLLEQNKFEESNAACVALRQRDPNYPGLAELQEKIDASIRLRDLEQELKTNYAAAQRKLNSRDYLGALQIWETIAAHKDEIKFPDNAAVESRAKEGLYSTALSALGRRDYQEALNIWNKLHQIDPEFEDRDNIVTCSQKGIVKLPPLSRPRNGKNKVD